MSRTLNLVHSYENGAMKTFLLETDIILLNIIAQTPRYSLNTIENLPQIPGKNLDHPHSFYVFFSFFNPRFDLHLNFYPLLHLVFKTWNHRDRAFYGLIFLGFPTMSISVYFCCLVAKSCLCDPMDSSLLDFSVHGISQAKILEGIAISFSRNQTFISCIVRRILSHWATREDPCVFYTHSVAEELAPLFLRGSDVYTVKSLRLH